MPNDLLELASIDHVHESAGGASRLLVHLAGALFVVETATGAGGALARGRGNEGMTVKGIHRHDVVVGRLRLSIGKKRELAENVEHPVEIKSPLRVCPKPHHSQGNQTEYIIPKSQKKMSIMTQKK